MRPRRKLLSLPLGLRFDRWQCFLVAIMLFAAIASAQQSAETDIQTPSSAQTPVPLADALTESESVSASLRDIRADLSMDRSAALIAERLSPLTREIDARLSESRKVLAQHPSVDVLGSLEGEWRRLRRELSAIKRSLSTRVDELDRQIQQLDDLAKTWQQTLTAVSEASAPTEVLDHLKNLLKDIRGARAAVQGQRARALTLQSRVSVQDGRVTNVLESIEQARQNILSSIFLRDSAPVWDLGWPSSNADRLKQDSMTSLARQSEALTTYTVKQGPKFLITIALFSIFTAGFYWARRRYRVLPGKDASSAVFNTPIAAALVLSFLFTGWTLPQPPRLLLAILGALALVPSVLIVRPRIRNEFRPVPYVLLACFILDQIRSITAAVELLPRAVFLAEMLLVAGLAGWFIRCGGRLRRAKKLTIASYLALVMSLIGIIASAAGYTNLATLFGNALVRSGYLALILYAVLEVLHDLVKIALHVRPFDSLAAVRRHRELLAGQVRRGLRLIAILFWIFALLSQLLVAERIFRSAREFLSAEISFGSIRISAGDVLAFIITLWAAFVVSRLIRFLLDEEVYPRLALKRGLPYAISATLHYLILFGGFFLALAALGVDMTRVTIIAGAFSVGVGLGLQNIFNNFISGLILLFERPISVGDIVQIEDASGVVEHIGVRASIIRMTNGSEVIMPNGKLISERVINWTLSTRQHGIELPITVAQGTDPGRVIELLEKTATAHPLVTGEPAPQALFVKLGPDSFGFELRAWTDRSERWMQIRSELAIAISATLAAEKIAIR
jgi:small-conductance mechanosensitive channel